MTEKQRKYGYVTADPILYSALKEHADKMKKYPTEAESILWNYIRGKQLGYRFRRQYIVMDYIPDFICLPLKLIIEIDGGYHFAGEQLERDEERTKYLSKVGYTVIRFTNEEVCNDIETVISKIEIKIREIERAFNE